MLKPSTIQRQLCGEIISRFEKKGLPVVRFITGYTNGRKADPGTIRGDYCMSNQQNIVHASDSPEAAEAELARFFKPEEIYELGELNLDRLYAVDEN